MNYIRIHWRLLCQLILVQQIYTPLEAFALGVPVLYSDLPGLRDQVGDSALLLDLNDPNSMAKNLINLMTDDNLRATLIRLGKNGLIVTITLIIMKLLMLFVLNIRLKCKAGKK